MSKANPKEVARVAGFLAASPSGHTTLDTPNLKQLLLETGGSLLCRGQLRDIRTKNLGVGVHKVWTVPSSP